MIEEGQLKIYNAQIKIDTPVFIGSGKSYLKNSFIFYQDTKEVAIVDIPKMITLISKSSNVMDEYERFILNNTYNGKLNEFLTEFFSKEQIESLIVYKCNAKDAFDVEHTLSEIQQFIRMNNGKPYLPGSSIKGAISTCLLAYLINKSPQKAQKIIEDNYKKENKYRIKSKTNLSTEYFNTLNLNDKIFNAVNSIMRTVSISDSEPLDASSLILARKIDISVSGNENRLNLVRESIKPGTIIKFKIAIDSGFKGVTIDQIRNAICEFSKSYIDNYVSKFKIKSSFNEYTNKLFIGGGVGYFAKSEVYHAFDYNKSVKIVSDIMQCLFKGGNHDKDINIGISPHMLKYTKYNNMIMPFGICELVIDDDKKI